MTVSPGHPSDPVPAAVILGEVEFPPFGSQWKLWLWAGFKSCFWKPSVKLVPAALEGVCYLMSAVNPSLLQLAVVDSVLFLILVIKTLTLTVLVAGEVQAFKEMGILDLRARLLSQGGHRVPGPGPASVVSFACPVSSAPAATHGHSLLPRQKLGVF